MSAPLTFGERIGLRKRAGPTHLTNMRIGSVSLVDKGANRRSFAILKRDGPIGGPIGKAATFGQLEAGREAAGWLGAALDALGTLIDNAMWPGDPALTPEARLAALVEGVDAFKEGLVLHVGAALQAQAGTAVAKRSRSKWAGFV